MHTADPKYIRNANFSSEKTLILTPEIILGSINHCYKTLSIIDDNLLNNNVLPLAGLVELANLSSIVGNLLGAGFADMSNGLYLRNKPHAYPDLVPTDKKNPGIEIKTALESNKPKGHLAKAGFYLTYRYVLTDSNGIYTKGKDSRGLTVTIWEVKFGYIEEADFSISNTDGDSGKTAVVKTPVLNNLPLLYLNTDCIPYKHSADKPYVSYN